MCSLTTVLSQYAEVLKTIDLHLVKDSDTSRTLTEYASSYFIAIEELSVFLLVDRPDSNKGFVETKVCF